jgi:hypothetical protein
MATIYDFSNPNTEYIYSLHPKSEILLHIKRETDSTAILYFTNQLNAKIDIPSGFVLIYNNIEKNIIQLQNSKNEFSVNWESDYDILYNGETICNIRTKKSSSIWIIYN